MAIKRQREKREKGWRSEECARKQWAEPNKNLEGRQNA